MAPFSVNLPLQLQEQAEQWAMRQGVPLEQFILWAVTEKVVTLQHQFYDPDFPHIVYRQGASGVSTAVIQGTGIRVQTVAIATHHWGMTTQDLMGEYDLTDVQVNDALGFYQAHQAEIDQAIAIEQELEAINV